MAAETKIKQLYTWIRSHPYWTAIFAIATWLLQEWINDILAKTVFDGPNTALLRWIGRQLGDDWMTIVSQFISESLSAILAVLAAIILLLLGRRLNLVSRPSAKKSVQHIASTDFPDWPIHELFYYLRPDLKNNPGSVEWGKVGQDVKDKFRHDRMKLLNVSGRPQSKSVPDCFFDPESLEPIPCEFWKNANFEYNFLQGESARNASHTKGGTDTYVDLHVNKAGALQVWPQPLISGNALRDDVLEKLAGLRSVENDLLELSVTDDASYQIFDNKLQSLRKQVYETIETYISAPEAKLFHTCGTVPEVKGGYSDLHNRRLGVIMRDVEWLAKLINDERRK